jgi:hypothetical protein
VDQNYGILSYRLHLAGLYDRRADVHKALAKLAARGQDNDRFLRHKGKMLADFRSARDESEVVLRSWKNDPSALSLRYRAADGLLLDLAMNYRFTEAADEVEHILRSCDPREFNDWKLRQLLYRACAGDVKGTLAAVSDLLPRPKAQPGVAAGLAAAALYVAACKARDAEHNLGQDTQDQLFAAATYYWKCAGAGNCEAFRLVEAELKGLNYAPLKPLLEPPTPPEP